MAFRYQCAPLANSARLGRSRCRYRIARFIEHISNSTVFFSSDDHVALIQCSSLHQERCNRTASLLETCLNHDSLRRPFGNRLQVLDLSLQQHGIQQFGDSFARLRRNLCKQMLTAPILRDDFML